MPAQARELQDIRTAKGSDPHCRLCVGVPDGMVSAEQVWEFAKANPGVPPFRGPHPDGLVAVDIPSG